MFPGLHNRPNYVLSQIKKKCFDEKGNITRESAKTLGVHQLVFSIPPPPQEQPKNRRRILEEKIKQLVDSVEQFKQVAPLLLDNLDSDDLNSLGYNELMMKMKEVLDYLTNAQATVDRMDKDALVEALSFLIKARTIIRQYDKES